VNNNRDQAAIKKFGEHLRLIRIAKNLSQQELELKAGISKNQIGNIERGEVNITLTSALAIASALEIPTKDLFDF